MAVVKMKKINVFAHARDADALVRRLMRLRCVELRRNEEPCEESPLPNFGSDSKCADIEKRISKISNAISILSKYSQKKKGLLQNRISVRLDKFKTDGSYQKAHGIIKDLDKLLQRETELSSEEARQKELLSSLTLWQNYNLPLDFEGTELTSACLVTLPGNVTGERIENALSHIPAHALKVGGDKIAGCYLLLSYRGFEDAARSKLSPMGMLRAPFEGLSGRAAEVISSAKKRVAEIERERAEAEKQLRRLAEDIELLEILYDVESTSLAAEEAKKNLGKTELCVHLFGWVPENEVGRVENALSKFRCAFEIGEPEEDDEVPVLLKNNFFASTFEWVLGMYSYPKYGTFDPTFIMSIFYFIIFGLMFADVGYGFIMTVACFGALKLLNPGKGMRNFLAMFGYCGISSMAMGVLFGAYFGNLPQAYAENMMGIEGASSTMQTAVLFDPLADPMSFLLLSLAIGAVHLIAGMAVQFYILCRKGQWVDALCDILTWWVAFAGLGLLFLFPWGKYVALIGVLSIVLTGGRHEKNIIMKLAKGLLALYGAVNFAADLLSYSRILALGLAASVIAQVVNTMGTMGGPGFIGFIIMILVFIIGHLLNLAINVLGTFVHTSRLQYIEFFGKFFEDGGKPFSPAMPSDKYTTEQ